ncbi:hypothetical protein EJ06DRAFT_481031 [Trichodelitschia bisporula]|uniref:Myb-like domain-containing protein n=1 Tax=Trichodelitschia bisporula TaxID=703511 RepID=A0A6G1HQH9_9PEZI|nr:hypothetical protein EJ06DRAFT_481031 [Trichodelitschia bisporula]
MGYSPHPGHAPLPPFAQLPALHGPGPGVAGHQGHGPGPHQHQAYAGVPVQEHAHHQAQTQRVPTERRSVPRSTSPSVSETVRGSTQEKKGKWTPEEDELAIELRRSGMKWDDISKRLPGRSAISCRLRYQNYSEKRQEWDEEKKNKLARLYNRFRREMWEMIAAEMGLPFRAVEAMHWQMGREDMAQRANVPVFMPHTAGTAPRAGTQPPQTQPANLPPPIQHPAPHPPPSLLSQATPSPEHDPDTPPAPPTPRTPRTTRRSRVRRASNGAGTAGTGSNGRRAGMRSASAAVGRRGSRGGEEKEGVKEEEQSPKVEEWEE